LGPLDPVGLLVSLHAGELALLNRLANRDLGLEIVCVARIAGTWRRVLGKAACPLRNVVGEEGREVRAAGQRERQGYHRSSRNRRAQHALR
jgi:hypothetical protein